MTEPTQTPQPQILDPDTAYAVVHQRVYAPVFFDKLASDFSIRPGSEQEAMEMLTMAAQLREAHDGETQKQAEAGTDTLSQAHAHLNQQLTAAGYETPEVAQNQQLTKQAAAQASFDPELATAILSLQGHAAGSFQPQPAA